LHNSFRDPDFLLVLVFVLVLELEVELELELELLEVVVESL
jgi:hypothetical protein